VKKFVIAATFINLITCFNAMCQAIATSGLVTADNQRQSGADVKNISTHMQTISNDIGEFSIYAKAGDTIITVKADYINDTSLITRDPYITIRLKQSPTKLREVVINARAVTPEKTLEENKTAYKEIYRIGDNSNIIGPDNIDKVWSAVSKDGKDARRMQRQLTTDYRSAIVNKRFTKTLVARVTGYKGTCLDSFMVKYRPSFEMIRNCNNYELIVYIKTKLTADKAENAGSPCIY
jgi:hypothetical protein